MRVGLGDIEDEFLQLLPKGELRLLQYCNYTVLIDTVYDSKK